MKSGSSPLNSESENKMCFFPPHATHKEKIEDKDI